MDGDGETPLMCAVRKGRLEVLWLLLGQGAAMNRRTVPDVHSVGGYTAFHLACFHNQAECAETLARAGCDVGIKDNHGQTGREIAEGYGHTAVVERLRAVVAEQLRAAPVPGPEPEPARAGGERLTGKLARSACEGDVVAMDRLLAAGADPNASVPSSVLLTGMTNGAMTPGASGEVHQTTPLCMAAQNGRLEAARLLLDAGADPSRADGHGVTSLMMAARSGHTEVLRLLLAQGAAVCRGAWARVTIDQIRHLALRT
jgi:hypothetical protein